MYLTNPKSIQISISGRTLTILWTDDHLSNFNFSFLRNVCPCVDCMGGHDKMGSLPGKDLYDGLDEINPATNLVSANQVGSYAISILWEDGHDSGIYTWKYLRTICPCVICMDESIED